MNVNGVDFKLVLFGINLDSFGMVIELLNMDGERYTVFKLVTEESEMTDRVIKVGVIGAGLWGRCMPEFGSKCTVSKWSVWPIQIYPAVKR